MMVESGAPHTRIFKHCTEQDSMQPKTLFVYAAHACCCWPHRRLSIYWNSLKARARVQNKTQVALYAWRMAKNILRAFRMSGRPRGKNNFYGAPKEL